MENPPGITSEDLQTIANTIETLKDTVFKLDPESQEKFKTAFQKAQQIIAKALSSNKPSLPAFFGQSKESTQLMKNHQNEMLKSIKGKGSEPHSRQIQEYQSCTEDLRKQRIGRLDENILLFHVELRAISEILRGQEPFEGQIGPILTKIAGRDPHGVEYRFNQVHNHLNRILKKLEKRTGGVLTIARKEENFRNKNKRNPSPLNKKLATSLFNIGQNTPPAMSQLSLIEAENQPAKF